MVLLVATMMEKHETLLDATKWITVSVIFEEAICLTFLQVGMLSKFNLKVKPTSCCRLDLEKGISLAGFKQCQRTRCRIKAGPSTWMMSSR